MKASQLLNQNIVANTNLTDETTRFVVVSGEDGRGMRALQLVVVLSLAGCGGQVTGASSHGNGESSASTSSELPGLSDSSVASGSVVTGLESSGAGSGGGNGSTHGADADSGGGRVTCSLPSVSEKSCVLCDNEWYCSEPRTPSAQCASNPVLYGPCTSTCVVCGDNGLAVNWVCGTTPPRRMGRT